MMDEKVSFFYLPMQHPNKNWKTPSSFCLRSESPFRLLEILLVGEEALVVGVALAGAAAVESVEGFFRVGASGRASSLTTTGTTVSFWKIRVEKERTITPFTVLFYTINKQNQVLQTTYQSRSLAKRIYNSSPNFQKNQLHIPKIIEISFF